MKISASILAIDNANIYDSLNDYKGSYDLVHVDVADNIFCPSNGIPMDVVHNLSKDIKYSLDVHFMIENPRNVLTDISNINAFNITVHCEAIKPKELTDMQTKKTNIGIGILADTNIHNLDEYIENVPSVLLLCVNPGFSYQKPIVNPVDRVLEFKKAYPNYTGMLSVDGGISNNILPQLNELNVDIAVQGGAIFGQK